MKKKLMTGLLLGSTLIAGCDMLSSNDASAENEITIWADGSDNVRDSYDAVIDAFHSSEYGEDYSINLEFIVSGSGGQSVNDRLIAAYLADEENTNFDLIGIDESGWANLVNESDEDLFNPINYDNIPNAANLIIDTHEYVMPVRGTTVVLAYDEDRVDNVPETAEELYQWIHDNPGKFSYNHPDTGGAGSSFVNTAIYNYLPEEALLSDDSSWTEEWDEGFDLLAELHPDLYQTGGQTVYPNTNQGTLDLLANQEIDMVPAWADMAIEQIIDGRLPDTTRITQLSPSFTGNTPGFAAPSIGSAESDAIEAVLDFWASDEAQEIMLTQMAAIPLVDSSNFDSESAELLEGFSVSEFRRIEIGNLGGEINERWDDEIATLQ